MKVYLECFGCLKHGGDVNATDHMKQTALHWAAVRGSVAVADVLLQNGAPVEAGDINGYRVIMNYKFQLEHFIRYLNFS